MLNRLSRVSRNHEHRVLGLMLLLLHHSIWWDFGSPLSRSSMLVHLGLFLLWQPFWDQSQRLDFRRATIFVVATLGFVAWLNMTLMAFWVLVLVALAAGRVTQSTGARHAYLGAVVFLVTEILVRCVPASIGLNLFSDEIGLLLRDGLLVLALILIAIQPAPRPGPMKVDVIYGLTMALLTVVLCLGGLTLHYITGIDYLSALVLTLSGIAAFLLVISWLWMPVGGFSGLGQMWERYVLNLGTPLERWLLDLQRDAAEQHSPDAFIERAAQRLADLEWVDGVRCGWDSSSRRGAAAGGGPRLVQFGQVSRYTLVQRIGPVEVTVFARRQVGPALSLHGALLLRLVAHFHRAKIQEREFTRQAQLQAVYETGARVTHDIKNLLQSLQTVTVAVEHSDPREARDIQALLKRQLPQLGRRLQMALDKLQAPESAASDPIDLSQWWTALRARYAGSGIAFETDLAQDARVPTDLLDNVAENLLENAKYKRLSEPGIRISARLESTAAGIRLYVHDSGQPIPAPTVERLFDSVVDSRTGLGIGLHQAFRHAAHHGYTLRLADNDNDNGVGFELLSNDPGRPPRAPTGRAP